MNEKVHISVRWVDIFIVVYILLLKALHL